MNLEEIKKQNEELKEKQATLEIEQEELQIAILKEIQGIISNNLSWYYGGKWKCK